MVLKLSYFSYLDMTFGASGLDWDFNANPDPNPKSLIVIVSCSTLQFLSASTPTRDYQFNSLIYLLSSQV